MTEDHHLLYGLLSAVIMTASASVVGWLIWLALSVVFG